ncbi:MAG: anion transporter [Alphaproteobacteria bacterium]|nr:anion transporter [Alphaproteobacteria bacterium]
MTGFIAVVFILTYIGMAAGRVPGLKLDRTGIAVLALAALLSTEAMDLAALALAIDMPTLVLLFALMIVSAQFEAAGFYRLCVARIVHLQARPAVLLAWTIAIAGGLSAVLANDIIVFAITPLLCAGLKARGLDPRPYLIALAGAANAGSAATLIGNPQNILIGQLGGLSFLRFFMVCAPVALLALAVVYGVVRVVWAKALAGVPGPAEEVPPAAYDRWQVAKGAVAIVALVALFLSPAPREVGALAIAAVLLASRRMASRAMIGAVDWHLLLLFVGLFAVTATFAATPLAGTAVAWLVASGWTPDSVAVMAPLALLMSNTVGNVPAVIMLLGLFPGLGPESLTALALLSTLAGNFLLVGSIANIIVAERAAQSGVMLGFGDFARAGVPMTLLSMGLACAWLALGGWLPWS